MSFRRLFFLILLSSLLLLPLFAVPVSAQPALLIQKTWGGSRDDGGQGVAVDSSGNTYVTGFTFSFGPRTPSSTSLSLLKYDPRGSLLWQRIWSGSTNGNDAGIGVAVDSSSGSIYVTGQTNSSGCCGGHVLLLKFDSSGTLLWQRTWGGNKQEAGRGVAVDSSSGSIYVTGQTNSTGAGRDDVLLLKFASNGSLLWQRTWGGLDHDRGWGGVAFDSSANIYVAGYTYSFGANSVVLLLKFASNGSLLWQRTWGGSTGAGSYGVAVDSSNNIYMTGVFNSTGHPGLLKIDVLLLKFDSSGSLLWQRTWDGSSNEAGFGVAVDTPGNIYVTGATNSTGPGERNVGSDVLLLKFDSSGSLLLRNIWNGTSSSSDYGFGVVVDSGGNARVTGRVNEAPPYTLGSPTGTLGTPAIAPGVPTGTLGTPTFTPGTPTGTVQTPSGSQSYAGGFDQFLIEYGTLAAPLSPSGVLLAALLATVTIALVGRRRDTSSTRK